MEHLELLHLVLKLQNQKDMHIIGIYRPPTGNTEIALERIRVILNNIKTQDEIVVMGDLNINWLNGTSSLVKALKLLAAAKKLTQVIDVPTWVTPKTSTLIDLNLSNIKHVSHSGTIDCLMSDHYPVFMIKKKARVVKNYLEKWYRPIKDLDTHAFIAELLMYTTISLVGKNPSKLWDEFYTKIIEILDRLCPFKLVRICIDNASFIDDRIISPDKGNLLFGIDAANAINDYFCNISVALASNLALVHTNFAPQTVLYQIYIDRAPLTLDVVIPPIQKIDTSKADFGKLILS